MKSRARKLKNSAIQRKSKVTMIRKHEQRGKLKDFRLIKEVKSVRFFKFIFESLHILLFIIDSII